MKPFVLITFYRSLITLAMICLPATSIRASWLVYDELSTNGYAAGFSRTNVASALVSALSSDHVTNSIPTTAPAMAQIVALIGSGGGSGGSQAIYTYSGNPIGIVSGSAAVNLCWDSLNKIWWLQIGTGTGGWTASTPSFTSFNPYGFKQFGYELRINDTNYPDFNALTNAILRLTVSNSAAQTMTNTGNVFVGNFTGNSRITNSTLVWYVTNNTPTVAMPDGSLCTVTDGRFYVRTNSTWVQK